MFLPSSVVVILPFCQIFRFFDILIIEPRCASLDYTQVTSSLKQRGVLFHCKGWYERSRHKCSRQVTRLQGIACVVKWFQSSGRDGRITMATSWSDVIETIDLPRAEMETWERKVSTASIPRPIFFPVTLSTGRLQLCVSWPTNLVYRRPQI